MFKAKNNQEDKQWSHKSRRPRVNKLEGCYWTVRKKTAKFRKVLKKELARRNNFKIVNMGADSNVVCTLMVSSSVTSKGNSRSVFLLLREEVHTQVATINVKLTLVGGWVWSRDVRWVTIWSKSFLTHFTSEGNDFCLPSSFFISLSDMIGALRLWQIAEENRERRSARNIQTYVAWSTLQYFHCSKIG